LRGDKGNKKSITIPSQEGLKKRETSWGNGTWDGGVGNRRGGGTKKRKRICWKKKPGENQQKRRRGYQTQLGGGTNGQNLTGVLSKKKKKGVKRGWKEHNQGH